MNPRGLAAFLILAPLRSLPTCAEASENSAFNGNAGSFRVNWVPAADSGPGKQKQVKSGLRDAVVLGLPGHRPTLRERASGLRHRETSRYAERSGLRRPLR